MSKTDYDQRAHFYIEIDHNGMFFKFMASLFSFIEFLSRIIYFCMFYNFAIIIIAVAFIIIMLIYGFSLWSICISLLVLYIIILNTEIPIYV